MKANQLFWGQGSFDRLTLARYRNEAEVDGSGMRKPLATMSEATRAAVVARARRDGEAEDLLVDELTALISDVYLLHGWLTQVFMTIKDSVGLTGIEALTLYAVINSGKPVTVPQIGRSLGHARQVIQRAANNLVKRGFLETRDNPAHKRAALLVPTDAGREVKLSFDAAGRAMTENFAEGITIDTVLATRATLRQIINSAELRAREPAASRQGKTES